MDSGTDFVSTLRSAAPYVQAHHGRTFVIAFPGEVCARKDIDRLLTDVAMLSSLGVRLVLVHGARPQIDRELELRGLRPKYVADLRVTDPDTMSVVKSAVGALRMDLEATLANSLPNSPIAGAGIQVVGGTWITAQPIGVHRGVDLELTGQARRIDVDAIEGAVTGGRIALVSPIGYSPSGETFNLRTSDVAYAIATSLDADKLIFILESDPGSWFLGDRQGDAGHVLLGEAEQRLADGNVLANLHPEDRELVQAALAAGRAGVKRVHLVGAGSDGALLRELYTRDGAGLMFYAAEDYEATRPATIEDIAGIQALIRPLESAGVLLPRTREQLELTVDSFWVMVRDGMVIACNAMVPYPDDQLAEFACVAVHPDYRDRGRAETLLLRAETEARRLGLNRLVALTTHTPHWFVEHGFAQGTATDLPRARRADYDASGRNSLVMVKPLPA